MTFTQTIIKEKTLVTRKRAVVERTWENGTKSYGIATCRRGGKWELAFIGQSRQQAMRDLKHHNENEHGVMLWCG
jgi:hypothetical protein